MTMPKERKDWVKVKLRKGKVELNDGRQRDAPLKLMTTSKGVTYRFEGDGEVDVPRKVFEGPEFKSARGYLEISRESVHVPDRKEKSKLGG
jgi:hypothetical protein